MNFKINLLITFSTIVLLVLCSMQFYLIHTTYEFKVNQFKNEVKEQLNIITNDYSEIDSTLFNKKDVFYKHLAENFIDDRSKNYQIRNQIINNSFKNSLTQRLQQKLDAAFPNRSIEFAVVLNKFVVFTTDTKIDTLFSEKPIINNRVYGNLNTLKDAFLVRNYVGTTSDTNRKTSYKLLTEDALYVSVKNWEMIILKRMIILLLFAFVTITTLVSIFFITIKALIKQKKISDIKTDFINNITHELKTPLTTLAISTKILERKETKENEIFFNQILGTISRQNEHLQKLIDQVLTNSLGYEEIQLQKEKIKITALLQNILDDFKVANPSIVIENTFNEKEKILELDSFLFATVITNVLENAVKYSSKTIYINTSIEKNQFNISIKDDGLGISKSNQSLLFDKFYRVNQGNIHNAKGLGLGLYYVDQIVKAHKGSIHLFSELGKGSLFTLSIPSTYK